MWIRGRRRRVGVIDTFQDPEPAADLLAAIERSRTCRYGSWSHALPPGHVNATPYLPPRARSSLHQERARLDTHEISRLIDPPVTAEKKARVQSIALPNLVYDTSVDLYLARASVGVLSRHTGGDSGGFRA